MSWYKFWKPESGLIGGLIIGLPLAFIVTSCLNRVTNPHDLKVGDCYAYAPDENPFEEIKEVYKCITDMKSGFVKYSYITRFEGGSWNCQSNSDSERWFNSSLYVKTDRVIDEFCG
jgi:hypothetical protein